MLHALCLLLNASPLQTQPWPAPSEVEKTVVTPGIGQRIDGYLDRLSGFGWSGAVLLIKDRKVVICKAYGEADRDRHIPVRIDSLFDIGSLGKQFTATMILRLEKQGKLSVNDPIEKHLPNVPEPYRGITIHQLLQHRGGIPGAFGEFEQATKAQALEKIFARPPAFKAGERFQYSNTGYTLLAAILEAVANRKYQDLVREELFQPAGMRDSGWMGKWLPPTPLHRVTLGYDEVKVRLNPLTENGDNWTGIGAGVVMSSLPDLYRWFLALQGEGILDPSQKSRMWTPGEKVAPSDSYFGPNYGYGWNIQTLPTGKTRIYHGGDGYAHGSGFSWYREDDMLAISLTNIRHDWFPTTIRADRIPPLIALGRKFVDVPAFSKVAYSPERIMGRYRLPSGGYVAIWKDDYGLQIGADGQDAVNLLDPAADKSGPERDELDKLSIDGFRGLFGGNVEAMKDLGVGPRFGAGVQEEEKAVEKRLGKLAGLRSLGMYTGGFTPYSQVLEMRFQKGVEKWKVHWSPKHVDATWAECPRYASPIRLQPVTADEWLAWDIKTRRTTRVWRTASGLTIEGPASKAEAVWAGK